MFIEFNFVIFQLLLYHTQSSAQINLPNGCPFNYYNVIILSEARIVARKTAVKISIVSFPAGSVPGAESISAGAYRFLVRMRKHVILKQAGSRNNRVGQRLCLLKSCR